MRYPIIRHHIISKKTIIFFLSIFAPLCFVLYQITSCNYIVTAVRINQTHINIDKDAHFNLLGTKIDLLETQLKEEHCNEGYLHSRLAYIEIGTLTSYILPSQKS